ncbi:4-hydroxybenzoate geranyltransferase 2 [Carex littledalei]|uniref:4-hydroxybenzoate geranyltransferase 2 n=1 Tax=Carex littledalei TaxID=544730 RepID=A0A833RKL7_9POAL|nr:4-hydroxybenzoate geranyltransferase 2 [Carex littledalei]
MHLFITGRHLFITGRVLDSGWPFYPFIISAAGQLLWQILTVDLSDPSDCNKKYESNKWFGALYLSGFIKRWKVWDIGAGRVTGQMEEKKRGFEMGYEL